MKYLLLRESVLHGEEVFLKGQDYHHVIRVLRYSEGDELSLCLLGSNKLLYSVIERIEKKQAFLKIKSSNIVLRPHFLRIHLVLPWLKREALSLCLQQAVETGVDSITLVATEFSVADKSHFSLRKDRYEKLIEQAGQQCGNPYLPCLSLEKDFKGFIYSFKKDIPFLYAHPDLHNSFSYRSLLNYMEGKEFKDCYILIGPEGGLSEGELELLRSLRAYQVSFPTYVLRSSTASLYLISLLQSLYQRGC